MGLNVLDQAGLGVKLHNREFTDINIEALPHDIGHNTLARILGDSVDIFLRWLLEIWDK